MSYVLRYHRTLLTLIAVLFVVCSYVALTNFSQTVKERISWYRDALGSNHVSVFLSGTKFVVDHGTVTRDGTTVEGVAALPVLALAYERLAAERDPLLALPGVDPDRMLDAISALEETANGLSLIQDRVRDAYLVRHALYPIRFLRAAAELERARLQFLQSGSHDDAIRYETATSLAINAYNSDLSSFQSAFAEVVPADIGHYRTERYEIGRDDVLHALEMLRADMRATKRRHDQRKACFRGVASKCELPDIAVPTVPVPLTEYAGTPHVAVQRVAAALRAIDTAVDPQLVPDDNIYFLLSNSACFAHSDPPHVYALRTMPAFSSVGSVEAPFYVGDIRFLESEPHRALPYLAFFADKGVTYVMSRAWTYYDCQNPDPDVAKVLSASDIRSFIAKTPLSVYAPDLVSRSMRAIEHSFLEENLVRDSDAASYLNSAAELVATGSLPEPIEAHVIRLLLAMHTNSAAVYHAAVDIARGEQTSLRLNASAGVPIDSGALYLFFTRSGFPSFFMASNPTVVGTPEALFPEADPAQYDTPYVYFSEADPETKKHMERDAFYYVKLLDSVWR